LIRCATIILSIIWVAGCALQTTTMESRPLTPRQSAAFQLTREGIQHLNTGSADNAIRSFEQAIGLNPNNGPCYYYMAQAWLAKGAAVQARQFNNLAQDLLAGDRQWEERVLQQTRAIEALSR
jgi:Tfp pilus assembly protein PilF